MKRYLAIAGFLLGAYFLLPSPPEARVGALEKGPKPRVILQSHAAIASLSISDMFKVALPHSVPSLGTKVLFSGKEQDAERERLSDRENINEAANALNHVLPKFSAREGTGRMRAVDFLVQSLTQSENPDYTIGAVAEVILNDSLYQTKDLEYRKSLVGDRVELYQALAITHPEVAQGIFQRAQGTNLAKVLRFAKGRADFNARIAMGH